MHAHQNQGELIMLLNADSFRAINPNKKYGEKKIVVKVRNTQAKPISAEKKAKVIAVLTEKGELSRSHISGYTGYDVSKVSKITTILKDEGILSRRQNGREAMFSLVVQS